MNTPKLTLDAVESKLRNVLLDAAGQIDSSETHPNGKTILRFTGGWVRDKLLSQASHDIDVAISNMTGAHFSERLKTFLDTPENSAKYGNVAFHLIAANPEKSKHLETVTFRIFGLEVDLVNLRKETYTEDSRNPQMEFGTPEEDALRRDATVNALFYNLGSNKVEDFTGKGLDDMKSKIIRTPLEPFQTFRDDPLRVLRLIRFASRLDFEIEGSAAQAMQDESIKQALIKKISRERVGIELDKMLKGNDPFMAVELIDAAGLYTTIFVDPAHEPTGDALPHVKNFLGSATTLQSVLAKAETLAQVLAGNEEDRYLCWLLACLVPYRDAYVKPASKKSPPYAVDVVRDGIKASTKICNLVSSSIYNRTSISEMVHSLRATNSLPRDDLGMTMREWGPTWRQQILFSLLADCVDDPACTDTTIEHYTKFISLVKELELLDVCDFKPIIDGKALAKAIDAKPGPWMKDALDVVMAWQLRHPESTDTAEVIEQIKMARSDGELAANLIDHFLRLTIRPLFVKTPHPAVTAQGRKVTTNAVETRAEVDRTDAEKRPWKQDTHVMSLLRWVVRSVGPTTVEIFWSMVVPPVLGIIDDIQEENKGQGCVLLQTLLESTPPSLLAKTGLTPVFQDALLPCLLCLPSLTPPEKSAPLLSHAFATLFTLTRSAYPKEDPTKSSSRNVMLDVILRRGIFTAYSHSATYPKIAEVLVSNLTIAINELGIESAKHIKHILPMLNEVFIHPFATVYPPLLLCTAQCMQALVLNTWPRMEANRGEVLRGLCLCWRRIEKHEGDLGELTEVREQLRRIVAMLDDALRDKCDFVAECRTLIEANAGMSGLFGVIL